MRDAGRLKDIPGIITQGRYDLLCPPANAARLVRAWGNCDLRIVADAGHAASEPGMRTALVAAIDEMGQQIAAK